METDPQILLVGPDRKLQAELASALACLADVRPVVSYQAEYRQGLEAARSRRPELALVQMTRDLASLKHFVEEAGAASPGTAVVALYYGDVFGEDVSESEVLIDVMRAGVRDFLRRPLSPEDLGQLLGRLNRFAAPRTTSIGKVVAFMSNKGGVGKSTLSVNIAADLARQGAGQVLLIDASLQMGVCASMLDLEPTTTLTDAARQKDRLDERLIREMTVSHSTGLHLLACPNDAIEASEIDDEIISRVVQLARRSYDLVLVDTFPMVDRVMTAILDLTDVIYIVTESTVPIIRCTAKALQLLDQLGIPAARRRTILNRYSSFPGNLKPADVATRCGCAMDYVIPYEKKLLLAANIGRPLILDVGRFSTFGRAIRPLIAEVGQRRSALTEEILLPQPRSAAQGSVGAFRAPIGGLVGLDVPLNDPEAQELESA